MNVASRLEADTREGCISISGSVYHDIKNRSDIHTKFVKTKRFKNVNEPIKVYEVLCGENGDQPASNNNSNRKIIHRKSLIFVISFLAVIGAGYWGPNLVRNLVSLPGASVSLVVDRVAPPGRAKVRGAVAGA